MANKPDKGLKGGSCNVTACQKPGANYYNKSTRKYYCAACAKEINWLGGRADCMALYGVPLLCELDASAPPAAGVDDDVGDSDELRSVVVRIIEQGAVRVNAAHLHRAGNGIAAVYVDLHSKRALLSSTGGGDDEPPSVTLEAGINTLHLDESVPRDAETTFDFPEYPGWQVFAAGDPGRYSLAVCLVAPNVDAKNN